jgi:hypothetical protein
VIVGQVGDQQVVVYLRKAVETILDATFKPTYWAQQM